VDVGAGILLIAAAAAVGLFDVFVLWARLPPVVVLTLLSVCGAVLGAGALLVQGNVGAANWITTLVALALLAPIHCRAVFGPPGGWRRHAAASPQP
jgi:hypothetical protein